MKRTLRKEYWIFTKMDANSSNNWISNLLTFWAFFSIGVTVEKYGKINYGKVLILIENILEKETKRMSISAQLRIEGKVWTKSQKGNETRFFRYSIKY